MFMEEEEEAAKTESLRYKQRKAKMRSYRCWADGEWFHSLKPLHSPRWMTREYYENYFRNPYYIAIDNDWARMRVLVAPRYYSLFAPLIDAMHKVTGLYWDIVSKAITWAEKRGWMKFDCGNRICWTTVWWAIKAARKAKQRD